MAFFPNTELADAVPTCAPARVHDLGLRFGHIQFVDLSMKSAPANPELFRGGGHVAIRHSLDQPTSLEFLGNTAYVVTLTGEIWKIDGVSCSP